MLDISNDCPTPVMSVAASANRSNPNLRDYDRIVVFFSGGKDSVACVLHLLELGVERSRIELHHHDVDGREGSSLMDWPVTRSYVESAGAALGLQVYFSWKVGGFEREMLRQNCGTAPITFTRGDGSLVTMGGDRSKPNTRRKFPQVTSDLRIRWCSSALKVEVGDRLLNNDERFLEGKTLVVTGERAQESASRSRYATFEPHRRDNRNGRKRRWIDHWRPVHQWQESEVWAILERWRVFAHPAYWVGLGRASCMACIFGSSRQWATLRAHAPQNFERIAAYENEFGTTIHRTRSVNEQADAAHPYPEAAKWMPLAMSERFDRPFFMDRWELPPGAYGESCGPV
jgi:3'-phosphoadenosine 5'-phosphosulfate sulfotransferase (PAPS reductase)/FAD synthetase